MVLILLSKGYDFEVGDRITISIEFPKGTITFTKNKDRDREFSMPIDIKKPWNPFVGLKYKGDEIEIIP